MKKLTLTFTSLGEMAQFVKNFQGGYVLNTITLTLTAALPEADFRNVICLYKATVKEPTI